MAKRFHTLEDLLPARLRNGMGAMVTAETFDPPPSIDSTMGTWNSGHPNGPTDPESPWMDPPSDDPTGPLPPMPGREFPVATNYASGNLYLSGDLGFVLDGVVKARANPSRGDYGSGEYSGSGIGFPSMPGVSGDSIGNPQFQDRFDPKEIDPFSGEDRHGRYTDPGYADPPKIEGGEDSDWVNGQSPVQERQKPNKSQSRPATPPNSGSKPNTPSGSGGSSSEEPQSEREEPKDRPIDEPDVPEERLPPKNCECSLSLVRGEKSTVIDLTTSRWSEWYPNPMKYLQVELAVRAMKFNMALTGDLSKNVLTAFERTAVPTEAGKRIVVSPDKVDPAFCGQTYEISVQWNAINVWGDLQSKKAAATAAMGSNVSLVLNATLVVKFGTIECSEVVALEIVSCNPAFVKDQAKKLQPSPVPITVQSRNTLFGYLRKNDLKDSNLGNLSLGDFLRKRHKSPYVEIGRVEYTPRSSRVLDVVYEEPDCCCIILLSAHVEIGAAVIKLPNELISGFTVYLDDGSVRNGSGDVAPKLTGDWAQMQAEVLAHLSSTVVSGIEGALNLIVNQEKQLGAGAFPICKDHTCSLKDGQFIANQVTIPLRVHNPYFGLGQGVSGNSPSQLERTKEEQARIDKKTTSIDGKSRNWIAAAERYTGCTAESLVSAMILIFLLREYGKLRAAKSTVDDFKGLPERVKLGILPTLVELVTLALFELTDILRVKGIKGTGVIGKILAGTATTVAVTSFALCVAKLMIFFTDEVEEAISDD